MICGKFRLTSGTWWHLLHTPFMEHSPRIWKKIQTAKRSKEDLHVVWPDPANAFSLILHQLIACAPDFSHVPPCIHNPVANNFNNLYVCCTKPSQQQIQFIRQGIKAQSGTKNQRYFLSLGGGWKIAADLNHQLKFPQDITTSSLRLDIVLQSVFARTLIMVELTVSWEEEM